ncbi:hypothetical protein MMC28_008902 [Mycoblastus sanguinarius]|nr:hypothetical protein [Mycoblastus sanguinarius]
MANMGITNPPNHPLYGKLFPANHRSRGDHFIPARPDGPHQDISIPALQCGPRNPNRAVRKAVYAAVKTKICAYQFPNGPPHAPIETGAKNFRECSILRWRPPRHTLMKLTAEEEAEFDFLVNMDGDDPVLEDVDKEKAKDVVEEEQIEGVNVGTAAFLQRGLALDKRRSGA